MIKRFIFLITSVLLIANIFNIFVHKTDAGTPEVFQKIAAENNNDMIEIQGDNNVIDIQEAIKIYLESTQNADQFTRELTENEISRRSTLIKGYLNNKIKPNEEISFYRNADEFYLSLEPLIFNIPLDRELTDEEILQYIDFSNKVNIVLENSRKAKQTKEYSFDDKLFEEKAKYIFENLYNIKDFDGYEIYVFYDPKSIFEENVLVEMTLKDADVQNTDNKQKYNLMALFDKNDFQPIQTKKKAGAINTNKIKSKTNNEHMTNDKIPEYIDIQFSKIVAPHNFITSVNQINGDGSEDTENIRQFTVTLNNGWNYTVLFSVTDGEISELFINDKKATTSH